MTTAPNGVDGLLRPGEHDATRPWLAFYGEVPASLDYPAITLHAAVAASAARVPAAIAWDFFDTRCSYAELLTAIDACAHALSAQGLRAGDRFLIAMPTAPQSVIAFYAANRLGAVPALIHPLSTSSEIEHYLDVCAAEIVLTLDVFYPRFAAARPRRPLRHIVLARIGDYLSLPKRLGFWLSKGRKIARVPVDSRVSWWRELLRAPHPISEVAARSTHDPAAILFSGGTTNLPKGIVLSNYNFIAQGQQALAWGRTSSTDSILAILPIFHGFGLGVCINATLMAGAKAILVPSFDAASVARLIQRKRPSTLVGVPTLFDALTRNLRFARADLSTLRAAFSGADTLPRAVKERFESLVQARGGKVRLLEGYGLTEAVTAIMAMPMDHYREGSIGLPFPDMRAKICAPGSEQEMAVGEEGEICLSGPALMLGYLDDPAATSAALRTHADGRVWLHTGDLGHRDANGFFYFSVRLKRMIKSSGFNVYPAQVEAVLCQHADVVQACVVGVPDPRQVERVIAFVVLHPGLSADAGRAGALITFCRQHLIKWSCPRQIEFRDVLPLTRVGKIDYRQLQQEFLSKGPSTYD